MRTIVVRPLLFSILFLSNLLGQQNIFRIHIPIPNQETLSAQQKRYGKSPYDGPPFGHYVQKDQYYHSDSQNLTNYLAEVRAAFATWNQASYVQFNESASAGVSLKTTGLTADGPAYTIQSFNSANEIQTGSTSITVSTGYTWAGRNDVSNNIIDLQSTMLHEVGHVLGIAHPDVSTYDINSSAAPVMAGWDNNWFKNNLVRELRTQDIYACKFLQTYVPNLCPSINEAANVSNTTGVGYIFLTGSSSLNGDISLLQSVSLTLKSGSNLNLNDHMISFNGGAFREENGATVNGVQVKSGSALLKLCPSIESAINAAVSGNTIEVTDKTSFSLSADVVIPSNVTLLLKSGSTLNLNGHTIAIGYGAISIESGANINCTFLKAGSTIVKLFPTIQSACDAAVPTQTVELQPRIYNEKTSLIGKSNVTISGYGATINGTINLTNADYCRLYGVYLPSGNVYINQGIGNLIMDVRSDREYEVLFIENTTNNAVYGLTATNGDMNNFGLYIYNSNGDICNSSRIENHGCGIYLYGTSSYNVTNDYFCNNGYDVDAEGGAFAYLMSNTMSRINPASVYGNIDFDDRPNVACSSPSPLAKSNTASLSLNKQSEVKGTPAGDLDLMYLDLIHRTSQDTALDHKGRIEKYKSEYLRIAEKSKGELKKSFNDLSKMKKSLSLTVNCLRYLGEEGSLLSYLNELLGMSDLQAYSPYIKKYFIPSLIRRQDYAGALAQCDEVLKAKDIDKDLTCEMLYEKGIINRFYLNNNTEAFRAFSSITAKYPDHPLGKMAMGQISDMPGIEVEKPGLKSLGSNSEGFTCSSYPNPFNPSTRFNFSIPSDGFTELKIYNSLGQEVKTLVSDYLAKGKYTFEWNAGSYSSGIYYYFLKSGSNVTTSKVILLK